LLLSPGRARALESAPLASLLTPTNYYLPVGISNLLIAHKLCAAGVLLLGILLTNLGLQVVWDFVHIADAAYLDGRKSARVFSKCSFFHPVRPVLGLCCFV
jgi:hypothetical protein